MKHVIRPYQWEGQVGEILSKLEDGDEIWLPDEFMAETVRQAMKRWGIETEVTLHNQPSNGNCKRCGGQVRGPFCNSCEQGTFHAQDCPKLWDGTTDPTFIEMAQEGPCNCGGDEFYRP